MPKADRKNDTSIIFRCSAEFRERLRTLAAEQRRSGSELIRELVATAAEQARAAGNERRAA